MKARGLRVRAALVVVALGASWLPVVWLAQPGAASTESFADVLRTLLAGALLICWCWWTVLAGALALELALTGSASRTGHRVPRGARLAVVALCGVGSLAGLAGPAAADPIERTASELQVLSGLAVPDRVTSGQPAPQRAPHSPAVTTVRPGDTLSAIAAKHGLAWRVLYAANREVVGSDPDLIRPGQRLVVPSHTTHEGAHR
ncbi:MAG TPA: LysM domain-containing protein [Nocardioidaceae bacterium]|nr:LysM domain-containing protein [Nocardioidaceae bacterium]